MIRFALQCDAGHGFESWFRDGAAYDTQNEAGLLTCPVCGARSVEKQIMAPMVLAPTVLSPATAGQDKAPPRSQPVAMMSDKDREMRAMLRAFKQHLEAHADNVGNGFAEEARKIHYGETDSRAIYGVASSDEAKALVEEGIEVLPVPGLPDEHH